MLAALYILAGILIGFGVANYLYDKKVAKLYKEQTTLLKTTHDTAFTQGWNAGENHGRRQEAIDRILKRRPEDQ